MEQTATIMKEIDAEGIKNLQLTTFAGNIEITGTDENIIKMLHENGSAGKCPLARRRKTHRLP